MRIFIFSISKNEKIDTPKSKLYTSCAINKLVPTFEKNVWYSRQNGQEDKSSIIKLSYLTITEVIINAFKEKWNPFIHLSLEIKRKLFYKGKGLGKGIPIHVVHESIYVGAMETHY
jgi:hypothetical protein